MRWFSIVTLLLLVGLPVEAADPSAPSAAAKELSASVVAWRKAQCCGVNCLYVTLRMHGIPVKYEELAEETAVGDQGSTFAELSRVARLHGLDLTPMQATRESVADWPLPAVLHLERQNLDRHYVLLLRRQGDEYIILDCTSGEISAWGEGEFRDKWSGYVLLAAPSGGWWKLPSWMAYVWFFCGVGVLGAGALRWRRTSRAQREPVGSGDGMADATPHGVPQI